MRVLVTWGTKFGGTLGIARIIGDELERHGYDVDIIPAPEVARLDRYDAVIIGGGVYANRWHADARHFVARHVRALRNIPVWLFSSGPLDDSADRGPLPTPHQIAVLSDRIGAIDHVTFGGMLSANAKGFPAAAMAKKLAGDWRNPERIRAWAAEVARQLPTARPRPSSEPPARAAWRIGAHAMIGWAALAIVMLGGVADVFRVIAAPLVFAAIAVHYFRPVGSREPLPTALSITALVALLDVAVIAGLVRNDFSMFASVTATWLPFALIFLAVWIAGLVMSTRPWPKSSTPSPSHREAPHASPA